MIRFIAVLLTGFSLMPLPAAHAQAVGSAALSLPQADLHDVAQGWSGKMQVLGQPVFNDQKEWIGNIDDVVIVPGAPMAYAVINVSFFLKTGKRLLAIRVSQLDWDEGKLILHNATIEAIEATRVRVRWALSHRQPGAQRTAGSLPGVQFAHRYHRTRKLCASARGS
jgi:hypothetical protein